MRRSSPVLPSFFFLTTGLGGDLPPILVSLVRKDDFVNTLLDDCPSAKKPMAAVKERLHKLLHAEYGEPGAMHERLNPCGTLSIQRALSCMLGKVGQPRACMEGL